MSCEGEEKYEEQEDDRGRPVSCGNCDWTGFEKDLSEICDFWERVEPDEIMPAGQCPECQALAHLTEETDHDRWRVAVYTGTTDLSFQEWMAVKRSHAVNAKLLKVSNVLRQIIMACEEESARFPSQKLLNVYVLTSWVKQAREAIGE